MSASGESDDGHSTCDSTSQDYLGPNFRKRLNEMWHNELFCDITLEVEGKKFKCHKVILAANSQYFQSMFSNGMSETSQDTIELKDLSCKVMEKILNHFYCESSYDSKCEVREALDILKAVDMLQIDNGLKGEMWDFVFDSVDDDNCFDVFNFTQYIQDEQLGEKAYKHALSNFDAIWKSSTLFDLDKDTLIGYLKDDDLYVTKEENVFHAVARWVLHDPDGRKKFAPDLFESVRFCFIEPKILVDEIDEHDFMDEFTCLRKQVMAAFRHQAAPCYQHEEHYYKCSPRNCNTNIYLVNPVNDKKAPVANVLNLDMPYMKTVISPYKNATHHHPSGRSPKNQVCLVGNQLYAFDGKAFYTCELKENSRNVWKTCATPPFQGNATVLKSFTLTLCGDFIYLIGGKNTFGASNVIYFYNHKLNTWQAPPDVEQALIHPVHHHRAVALKGNIYIIGGCQPDYTGSMFLQIYDTIQGKVTLGPDSPKVFTRHSAVSYKQEIYVFAPPGIIAKYSPSNQQWTMLKPTEILIPNYAVSFVKDSEILLLGGKHIHPGNTWRCADTVLKYDTVSGDSSGSYALSPAVCIDGVVKLAKNSKLKWL